MNVSWPVLLLFCGVLIAIVLVLFWHPQRSRTKTSTSADRQRTDAVFRDDDRYWYGGFFYNNPDDPAVFVPKRYGLGWTMNFGHPQARLVLLRLDATRLDAPRSHKKIDRGASRGIKTIPGIIASSFVPLCRSHSSRFRIRRRRSRWRGARTAPSCRRAAGASSGSILS